MSEREREKEKEKLLIVGYMRQINITNIPLDIINLFILFYHATYKILQFSKIYCTQKAYVFSDDNKCVTRSRTSGGMAYIVADIEPVKDGIHCWRIKVI